MSPEARTQRAAENAKRVEELKAQIEAKFRTKPEGQLLEILREQETAKADFKLRIDRTDGAWEIELSSSDVKGAGIRGVGRTFAEAWDNNHPIRSDF